MSCPFDEEVSAWFDGELPDAQAERVSAHVAGCASCTALVADFESVRGSLRILRNLDVPRLPLWQRRVRVPLPVAAALALLVVAAPFVAFRRGEQSHPVAVTAIAHRPSASGLLAPYDGGGRAVIAVRAKEQVR